MADNVALMSRRIRRILLVCNNYDNFSLEEDGRLDMRISREYSELNLSNPPQFVRVETTADALRLAEEGERFDLVITMYNVGSIDVFDFSGKMKAIAPQTPIVLLTSYSKEVWRRMQEQDRSNIDYAFCWSGSTDLIIAIISAFPYPSPRHRELTTTDSTSPTVNSSVCLTQSVAVAKMCPPSLITYTWTLTSSKALDSKNSSQ